MSKKAQPNSAPIEEPAGSNKRTVRSHRIKLTTVGIYFSVFSLLVAVISIGYRSPEDVQTVASVSSHQEKQEDDHNSSALIGNVEAATIAANVASSTDLSVAPLVANMAQSKKIENAALITADSTLSKPVITEVSSVTRNIPCLKMKR